MTTVTPRGFLFALDDGDVQRVTDAGALDLHAVLEPLWGQADRVIEADRAWRDIHRALALNDPEGVLSRALLVGQAPGGSSSRIVLAREVEATSRALARIDYDDFRDRFISCLPGDPDEEGDAVKAAYAYRWFTCLQAFYRAAASARRAVLFTVDLSVEPPRAVRVA